MGILLSYAPRQRPQCIAVGEARLAGVPILFQAFEAGHAAMATFHAAGPAAAMRRPGWQRGGCVRASGAIAAASPAPFRPAPGGRHLRHIRSGDARGILAYDSGDRITLRRRHRTLPCT